MLIQWVTQIIIFLLLASIIDLLIPATAMKKYIKLVVGLILMLIFLKPIFYLFSVDIENELDSALSKVYQEEINTDSIGNLTKIKKSEIQASQDAYILEEMSTRLKEIAKAPLLDQHQVEIADIHFLFSTEQIETYEDLAEVIVYLRKSEIDEGAVSIVDDVEILADENTEEGENEANNDQIRELLQDVWELTDKKLTIKWGGGRS